MNKPVQDGVGQCFGGDRPAQTGKSHPLPEIGK